MKSINLGLSCNCNKYTPDQLMRLFFENKSTIKGFDYMIKSKITGSYEPDREIHLKVTDQYFYYLQIRHRNYGKCNCCSENFDWRKDVKISKHYKGNSFRHNIPIKKIKIMKGDVFRHGFNSLEFCEYMANELK